MATPLPRNDASFSVEQLIAATSGEALARREGVGRSVVTDSRAVVPGAIFVALRGAKHDAHDYLDQVFAARPFAVIVSRDVQAPSGVAVIRVPDTLRAAGRPQTEVARRDGDDRAEDDGLDEPLDEIVRDHLEQESARDDLLEHGAPVEAGGQPEHEGRDDVPADDADEVVDDGKHGQHHERRDEAWRRQLLDGIGAERIQCVDLFRDFHRSELRGDA